MPDDDQILPDTGAESVSPATVAPEPELSAEAAVPEAPAEPGAAAPAERAVAELSPAECAARLAELFPALFAPPPKPLKLRIQADIQARAPGVFTRRTLSVFLHRYTTSNAYLSALVKSEQRYDLDGQPAGELSAEHRELAAAEITRRRGVHEQRRAAERAAARAADAEARRQQQADHDARRDRAGLLRAFETTTLTPANFCALKGIAESELEAVLEQARRERAERPPMPPREARPGGPRPDRGPRRDGERGPGPRRDGARPQGPRGERGPRPEGQGRPPKR
ncbi:ProQ/FINO family protein [Rubrivivax benzoatilyticus]|uniref:Prop effector ProQ n=1 Tax=Rubrivivax benzoatilyticus TaxID=316997 RepID=A0ABX0HUN4_9BURK|nr:ProQ/FINO family protein [Rubrivivax benzoatilyticus]NHK98744.1 prop effector ProQ [Rubrivivax benzoatilyticus]NHL24246.1 prop effector ProQ [Rubrivivax benzoatilyticus]